MVLGQTSRASQKIGMRARAIPSDDARSRLLDLRRKVRSSLVFGVVLLSLLHMAVTWPEGGILPRAIVQLVHVDREGNLPTWFSASEILILALVFFAISCVEAGRQGRAWAAIVWCACGAASAFLSADEAAGIHEAVGDLAGDYFRSAEPGSYTFYLSYFPSYYWALFYVPIGVPLLGAFGRFAWRELAGSRLMATSGLLAYVAGAVVLDHIEGRYGNPEHQPILLELAGHAFRFDIFLVEELLEMTGVLILIDVFLGHLAQMVHVGMPR